MPTQNKENNYQKFVALDTSKQERIINAAMKEFTKGYKNALTDNIVKEAGISKGLIFHYFGTKEGLYSFLMDYASEMVQKEYLDKINIVHSDILDNIWQLTLLKGEMSLRYPALFDFVANAYMDTTAPGNNKIRLRSMEAQADLMEQILASADFSLFREDIDPERALRIIFWAVEGYANSIVQVAQGEGLGSSARENYDNYLVEFEEVIKTLRKCFYR